jgi:predicted amidohydrolase
MRYVAALVVLFLTAGFSNVQPEKLRLGLFTGMVPIRWDLEGNWRAFEQAFLAHVNEGIDLVVTPECFLDGYAVEAKDWTLERFARIAQEPGSSPYIAKVRALARKYSTSILFGFTENDHGKFYDCALLVDRQGEITGHYHKTHLQDQDLRFSPGDDLPVFDTAWGKCGILICADRRWPETARVLRVKGSRITLIPAYGMWHIDNEWWMRTRSYENENFVAFVHPQVAFVSDPHGQIAAKLQTNVPSILVCEIDLSQVSDKAHIRDRRPELYEEIARPNQSLGNSKDTSVR